MIALACLTIGLTAGYILKGQMDKAVGTLSKGPYNCGPDTCTNECGAWNQCDVKWSE